MDFRPGSFSTTELLKELEVAASRAAPEVVRVVSKTWMPGRR